MSSYAQPSAVARGETEFSLTWGQQVFRHLNNLFGDYTLPKLDQIAIPDLEWSTEPSWGLISFRESLLLHTANCNPRRNYCKGAENCSCIYRKFHNYFGNLVSPVWWTFLWMNEGFATLYEKYIVDSINGPPDQYELFMITTKDEVMSLDVNGALVPLNHYVESPSEINDKAYDVIVTHYKAAFVLFMARTMLQQITFEKGVRYYLAERAFNSATPDDLHSGLQRSYDEDNPGNGVDIADIMWPWQNIRGYPVVTVTIEGDVLTLKQEGFRTPHDELYGIPISIATASNPNFSYPLQQIYWMTSKEMQISLSDPTIGWVENDWIVVNVRNFAYYVTNYDDNLWNLLIEELVNEPENIHFENRGALFANFHLFIEHAHDVSSTIFLRLAELLQVENEVTVWRRADRGLLRIGSRLRGTELFQGHETYLRNLFAPIYERMLNDEHFNTQLVDLVRFWSCTSGIQECLDSAIDELYDTTCRVVTVPWIYNSKCNGPGILLEHCTDGPIKCRSVIE
ncbi:hypothetical protein HA402_008444 [Bradysia odoriphaga]|nr:hypothetical protein HA402_008444 [Bradysia odoriphaga]